MQCDGPRRARARNENDDREGNACVARSSFLQTKVAIAAQYASDICTSRAIITDTVAATAVRVACAIEEGSFRPKPTISYKYDLSNDPALARSTIVGGPTFYISKEGAANVSIAARKNPPGAQ